MSAILYKPSSQTSADNETAITFGDVPEDCTMHNLQITTTGSVAAGEATVACDGVSLVGVIDLTDAPLSKVIRDISCSSIVITPSSFTADCTFTASLRSW